MVMRAKAGDRIIVAGGTDRIGVVLSSLGPDGSPPYVIKWLKGGHIAMVSPDKYSRIVPAEHPAAPGPLPGAGA
jgi:Domain of unknown function (DUF1918)